MGKQVFERKEFTIDRYRRGANLDNGLDGTEIVLLIVILSLMLFMAVARIDEKMQQRSGNAKTPVEILSNTKNNPGRVEPISNYIAGVND